MAKRDGRRLKVGVLGCGAIAQAAHFDSCTKARNADLYAICDVAPDLLARMESTHEPKRTFSEYDAMLADSELDAVIVATSDAFHVPASIAALEAGKHVLCEKPIGVGIEEVERLRAAVATSGKVLQIGHMKRFDAGFQAARAFTDTGMGELLALKAWYCDSTHRYAMTDAVQPLMVTSTHARKPAGNPKADLRRYYMLAHGSHLVDTARYFAGDIVGVEARLGERFGAYCWFVDVEFANGTLGHLDLTVPVRMDWHEGFQIYGQNGSVLGKTFNPWCTERARSIFFDERAAGIR
jgi:predicted dehydrogenase